MFPPGGNIELSIKKTSAYFGFDYLQLPDKPGANMSFLADTLPVIPNPPESANQFPLWYTQPEAQILTLALSCRDLEALGLSALGVLAFSYRIKCMSAAAQPVFFEGTYAPESTAAATAEAIDNADFFPLPQLGIKLLLPRYAVGIQVRVTGSGEAAATNWANAVRIGAQIAPASQKSSYANKQRMPLVAGAGVGSAASFMPRFAHTVDVPSTTAGASTIQFRNVGRAVVATYATGLGPIPIPPDAVSLNAAATGYFAGFDCY